MKQSIYSYFLENPKGVDDFHDNCCSLHKKLAPTSAEEAAGVPQYLRNVSQHDHSHHNQALFETLQEHCQCLPGVHLLPSGECTSPWHPTRLCLEGDSAGATFGILVSSMDMSSWQEFRLSVYVPY